jgi:hypothetical protein
MDDNGQDPAGPVWLKADEVLDRIQTCLKPGELFSTPHFSLFEAMSAVEVGDPKLDICAARPPDASQER